MCQVWKHEQPFPQHPLHYQMAESSVSVHEHLQPASKMCKQNCIQEGICIQRVWAVPLPDTWDTTGYGQQAGGTHPSGMYSCFQKLFYNTLSCTTGFLLAKSHVLSQFLLPCGFSGVITFRLTKIAASPLWVHIKDLRNYHPHQFLGI